MKKIIIIAVLLGSALSAKAQTGTIEGDSAFWTESLARKCAELTNSDRRERCSSVAKLMPKCLEFANKISAYYGTSRREEWDNCHLVIGGLVDIEAGALR